MNRADELVNMIKDTSFRVVLTKMLNVEVLNATFDHIDGNEFVTVTSINGEAVIGCQINLDIEYAHNYKA